MSATKVGKVHECELPFSKTMQEFDVVRCDSCRGEYVALLGADPKLGEHELGWVPAKHLIEYQESEESPGFLGRYDEELRKPVPLEALAPPLVTEESVPESEGLPEK